MSALEADSDQTVVINDLLSFAWCKRKIFKKQILVTTIHDFYSSEDVLEAFKTLLTALPSEYVKAKQKSLGDDEVHNILNLMQDATGDDLPLFVCKDLNNVPKTKIKRECYENINQVNEDGVMKEHERLKSELQVIFNSLYEVKKKYESVSGHKLDISELEKNAEKFGVLKRKPVVKDLSYLQSLIDEDGNNDIMEVSSVELNENEDDIMQQRINLIANRRQRASLRMSKKTESIIEMDKENNYPKCLVNKNYTSETKGNIIVDTLFDQSRKISKLIYRCSYCPYRSTEKTVALNHFCEFQLKPSTKPNRKRPVPRYFTVEHHFHDTIGAYVLFKCSACNFQSNGEDHIIQHNCVKLSYEKPLNGSLRSSLMSGRVKTKPGKRLKSYDCHSCGASFKMRKDLQKHIESHLGGGHRCPLCSTRLPLENWLGHVRNCPGDGTTSLEDHYCEVCDVFYADKRTLSFHRAYHDPSRPFQCAECKFRFYTQKTVEDHFRTHELHRDSKMCPFCKFRAFKAIKIIDHIRCHTGDRPYKCPQCDRSCTTFNALKVHLTAHAPERDYPCDICGKKFKSRNKVASHRKIHNMERPHKCPICGKGFKFGLQMALHHRMHLDIRKHPCPICPYKARTAAVLRGHMNTHTKAKPYKCTQCDFGANHKSYLNWHIKCYHPKPDIEQEAY